MNRTIAGGLALGLAGLTVETGCTPPRHTVQEYYQDAQLSQRQRALCDRLGLAIAGPEDCARENLAGARRALHGNSAGDPSRT